MTGPTVLVVDDDKLTRFSLSTILGRAGYRVREAGSAAEGMSAIEGERPGVVLLDIRLPDRDGLAVLQGIRANYPGLPVIVMTAHHSEGTERAANALGAWAYLAKPCDAAKLRSLVSAALRAGPPSPSGPD